MSKFVLVFGNIISILLAGSVILGLIGQLGSVFVGEDSFHYYTITFSIIAFITIKNIVKPSSITLILEGLYVIYVGIVLVGGYQFHRETFDYIFKLPDDEITQEKILEFLQAMVDSAELSLLEIAKESYIYATDNIIIFLLIFSSIIIIYWLRYYFIEVNKEENLKLGNVIN